MTRLLDALAHVVIVAAILCADGLYRVWNWAKPQ